MSDTDNNNGYPQEREPEKDGPGAFLLLTIFIPNASKSDNADDMAEALLHIINEERRANAGIDESYTRRVAGVDCGVGLFPAAQWLTPEVYRELNDLAREMRARRLLPGATE